MAIFIRRVFARRAFSALSGALVCSGVAACSGGTTSGVPAAAPVAAPSMPAASMPGGLASSVALTVQWPSAAASASLRRPSYVSNSTAGVVVTVTSGGTAGAPVYVNNPNLSPGPSKAFTQSTTVSVSAPVGSDTFAVSAYDATNGKGNLLGAAAPVLSVASGQANVLGVTLDGNLAKIAVAATPSTFLSGTFPAYTVVGQSAQQFTLMPEDADGNVIISPGAVPALTLTSATPASVSATGATAANAYAVQAHVEPATVTLTAAGKNLAGAAVTTTFTVSTIAALYVANHGVAGANPSVAIYPVTATAASTPIAVLQGPKTLETQIQFPAVDGNGTLYLSNQGPMPGGLYGPTSGYVTIFKAASQNGNNAPDDTITNLARPEGLAFDTAGDLYVMLERSLVEYGPGAGAASAPIATIGGPSPTTTVPAPTNHTDVDGCYGVSVDSAGLIYTACTYDLAVYAKGAAGNVAPIQEIAPTTSTDIGGMPTYGSDSWLSVAADGTGEIYAPESNNNLDAVTAYAAGATDGATVNAMPAFTAMSPTAFDQPWGVATDAQNQIYVSNFGGSSVDVFATQTALRTGVPTTTLTTSINHPYGIAVR